MRSEILLAFPYESSLMDNNAALLLNQVSQVGSNERNSLAYLPMSPSILLQLPISIPVIKQTNTFIVQSCIAAGNDTVQVFRLLP